MEDSIEIETDAFEHREVKPHFINPCCFGEDLATWVRHQLSSLSQRGFHFDEPIQEDYGWGFWVKRNTDSFWVAFAFMAEGPTEEPGRWMVSVEFDAGLNILKRLFHKPDAAAFAEIRDGVWTALKSHRGIRLMLDEEQDDEATEN
jgi:hypothetical protein